MSLPEIVTLCFEIFTDLHVLFIQAGISGDMLSLALEPEAASLFCCKRELGVIQIPVGCKYMVLDLGGKHEVARDHENPRSW